MKQEEWKQAKEYALRSLTRCDQTEWQLRQKLEKKGYSDTTTEKVICFLKEYHYIDDERFLEQYIESHCSRLNRKQLKIRLYRKGISGENLEEYLERCQYDEDTLLRKAVDKYMRNKDRTDPVIRRKAAAYLMQKGYSYSKIRKALEPEEVLTPC